MRVLSLAIAVVALAVLFARDFAQASHTGDITFEGAAGGGTITVTLTEDLLGVRRVALTGVEFLPAAVDGCGATLTEVRHYDPPQSVTSSGTFSATLLAVEAPPAFIGVANVSGTVGQDGITDGVAGYAPSTGQPKQGCFGEPLAWSAAGAVETAPGPNDLFFSGSAQDSTGTISITLTPDASGVTSIALEGLTLPCVSEDEALDARDFFDPPVSLAEGGTFQVSLIFSRTGPPLIRRLRVMGMLMPGSEVVDGTLAYDQFVPSCTGEAAWGAQFVPATPTPASTATATAAAPATATPTSGAGPVALPDAGGGARSNGSGGLIAIGVLLGAGALAAGAARLRAR